MTVQPSRIHTFALAVLACFSLSASWAAPADKPHIVMFVADDHGYFDSGPYGDEVVRTPNINRLVAKSLRFTQAFAASPLCVPSRCA